LAEEEARRAFDIGRDILVRTKLVRLGEEENVLLITLHHIVSDGWSIGVVVKETRDFVRILFCWPTLTLPELELQYGDYAVWQRSWMNSDGLKELLNYWRTRLNGVPMLELPTDRVRLPAQRFRGAYVAKELGPELSRVLSEFRHRQGATLFMILLTAYKVLLSRYSKQADVAVGTPICKPEPQGK